MARKDDEDETEGEEPKQKQPKARPKPKSLAELARQTNETLGAQMAAECSDDVEAEVPYWISTGSRVMDFALGGGVPGKPGGWAGNRIVEVFADPNIGKTLLSYKSMADAQRQGGLAALIDVERQHTMGRARDLGVDTDLSSAFYYACPDNLGECFEVIEQVCQSGLFTPKSLLVWDSLSATEEGHAGKKKNDKGGVAKRPTQIRGGFRAITPLLHNAGVTCLVINHTTVGFYGKFQTMTDTGGGSAFKFWASQRVLMTRKGKFTVGDRDLGNMVSVQVKKTRVAAPPDNRYTYVFPITPDGVPADYEALEFIQENKLVYEGKPIVWTSGGRFYISTKSGLIDQSSKEDENGHICLYYKDLSRLCEERPDVLSCLQMMAFELGELP